MPDPAMNEEELCKIAADLVKDAQAYRTLQSPDRIRSMEYYDGEMEDTPSDEGRSKVVSRDVRGEIKKVLPSIKRIILRGAKIVEYQPNGPEDEQSAEQATDYINTLVIPESGGKNAIRDAIDDAAKLRNGILKWWQDVRIDIQVSSHSGLDDNAFAMLVADDDVEVLEHTQYQKSIEVQPGVSEPATCHDIKIRRKIKKSRAKLASVPLENWLIHPDAICIKESPIVGEDYRYRRSDLVAMGYDRDVIDALPMATSHSKEGDVEEITRRREVFTRQEMAAKSMQEVDYYELLVRVDFDNDGIAELRRLVFAGGLTEKYLLENDYWDEVNYADVVIERRPHQWEGNSVADDVSDIQRIKTVLLRQTLDNLYWQNNQQPIVQEGVIINPEAVTNPAFGMPIRVDRGTDIRTALGFNVVPFVADKSFQMLAYLDEQKQDRTGINDASAGLSPDALQNVTAKASAMLEQSGIGQTEDIVEAVAESLQPVFKGLLKLVTQHQDKPRTVRLRKKWVTFDPRTWNADMDCTVNTGLGAGTRERDMLMMQVVTGMQEKLLAAFGPSNNLYVKPEQLYNGIAKTVEASGLKSVDQYFSNPTPEEVQAYAQAKAQQPSPEQEKTQGALQIEQAKGQTQLALADKKMQVEANKEREQRDADIVIKQAELEKETQKAMHEAQIKSAAEAEKMQIEREKIASQERMKLAEIEANIMLERERMDREDARAERQHQADAENRQLEQSVQ
jgi:hypothetical protein